EEQFLLARLQKQGTKRHLSDVYARHNSEERVEDVPLLSSEALLPDIEQDPLERLLRAPVVPRESKPVKKPKPVNKEVKMLGNTDSASIDVLQIGSSASSAPALESQ